MTVRAFQLFGACALKDGRRISWYKGNSASSGYKPPCFNILFLFGQFLLIFVNKLWIFIYVGNLGGFCQHLPDYFVCVSGVLGSFRRFFVTRWDLLSLLTLYLWPHKNVKCSKNKFIFTKHIRYLNWAVSI